MNNQQKEEYEARTLEAQNGAYARQVLDNPAYKQAMIVIRADLMTKFNKISYKETDDLMELKRRMDTAEQFQTLLERTMQEGKLAQTRLEKLKSKLGIK
jgi:hypothetical protein